MLGANVAAGRGGRSQDVIRQRATRRPARGTATEVLAFYHRARTTPTIVIGCRTITPDSDAPLDGADEERAF